jgi:hypothetical protein
VGRVRSLKLKWEARSAGILTLKWSVRSALSRPSTCTSPQALPVGGLYPGAHLRAHPPPTVSSGSWSSVARLDVCEKDLECAKSVRSLCRRRAVRGRSTKSRLENCMTVCFPVQTFHRVLDDLSTISQFRRPHWPDYDPGGRQHQDMLPKCVMRSNKWARLAVCLRRKTVSFRSRLRVKMRLKPIN